MHAAQNVKGNTSPSQREVGLSLTLIIHSHHNSDVNQFKLFLKWDKRVERKGVACPICHRTPCPVTAGSRMGQMWERMKSLWRTFPCPQYAPSWPGVAGKFPPWWLLLMCHSQRSGTCYLSVPLISEWCHWSDGCLITALQKHCCWNGYHNKAKRISMSVNHFTSNVTSRLKFM